MQYQAEFTTSGTRSTSGDGTAVIAAPASDKLRWHITGLILVAGDPGTDEVTVILKSGETTKATFPINDTAAGYMSPVDIVGEWGEGFVFNLSDAVAVHWTLSYYLRSDGKPDQ